MLFLVPPSWIPPKNSPYMKYTTKNINVINIRKHPPPEYIVFVLQRIRTKVRLSDVRLITVRFHHTQVGTLGELVEYRHSSQL